MTADTLSTQLQSERAEAIQHLLRSPMLNVAGDRDAYTLVARHHEWLVTWFDETCGWALHVDPAAGYARLAKRRSAPDVTRPLTRERGSGAPYDRRRYELLCLVAAELVAHPMTTVGLLAAAVASSSDFATEVHRDRAAFVDALMTLRSWGTVDVTSGDLEGFASDERANALLTADLSRLHRLIATATAPSKVPGGTDFDEAMAALLAEPRYGSDGTADSSDPHRWTRHRLARRLIDDPVLHLDDCSDDEIAYLTSGAGRTWLRTRLGDTGFILEERADGLLAIDADRRATDDTFPAPGGTVHQMALLLTDALVEVVDAGDGTTVRRPRARTTAELTAATHHRLAEQTSWAKAYQDDGGAARLAAEATDLLASFGLARVDGDVVAGRPAICRYQPGDATATEPEPTATLF